MCSTGKLETDFLGPLSGGVMLVYHFPNSLSCPLTMYVCVYLPVHVLSLKKSPLKLTKTSTLDKTFLSLRSPMLSPCHHSLLNLHAVFLDLTNKEAHGPSLTNPEIKLSHMHHPLPELPLAVVTAHLPQSSVLWTALQSEVLIVCVSL